MFYDFFTSSSVKTECKQNYPLDEQHADVQQTAHLEDRHCTSDTVTTQSVSINARSPLISNHQFDIVTNINHKNNGASLSNPLLIKL